MVFRRFVQAAVGLALIVGGASAANFADATTPATDPGAFQSLTPQRLLDTRYNVGATGPVAAHGTVALALAGTVPAGAAAVVLNVTVTQPKASGYITAYGDGTRPVASNLNFLAGQTVPNLVIAPIGAGGIVRLYNGSAGTTQLIADVAGYHLGGTPAVAGAFQSLPAPQRQLDTRYNVGATGPVAAHGTVALALAGTVPAGAAAVVLNVTVTQPKASGYITVYGDSGPPVASNLNFLAGQTVPNLVIAPIGTGGIVRLYNGSAGTTQLIADVAGYYLGGTPAVAGAFQSLPAPQRQLDTRYNVGATGPVAAHGTVALSLAGTVPAGAAAVVLNVTVTQPKASGYITAYGDGGPPVASNLNFLAGQTVPNLVIAPIGAGGIVRLYNGSAGTTQLIADVAGYFMGGPPPPGPVTGVTASGSVAGGITLSWTNPPDASYTGVMIRRAVGTTPPATITDGTLISDVAKPGTSFNDTTNLTHSTTYSYSLFAHSSVPSYAAGATATTTLGAFSWNPTHQLIAPTQGHMRGVSCPSSSFCAAVDQEGNALTYNGSTWTPPTPVAGTASLVTINAVSCTSSTFCAAVDFRGGAIILSGTTWTRSMVDNAEITSVSCISSSFCAAVDVAGKGLIFNGSNWSASTIAGAGKLTSVSCAAATFCIAVDASGNWTTYNGSWTPAASLDTVPGPPLAAVALTSVSCSSTSFCVAGDKSGRVLIYNAGAWSSPVPIGTSMPIAAISCTSNTFCMAVDTKGGALNYNGGGWVRTAIDGTTELTAVSCVGSTFCVATDSPIVDNTGNWLLFNNGSWGLPASIDPHVGPLSAVSCPTPSFCAAVDRRGNALTYNGSVWTVPASIANTAPITGVSCPTSTFCAAVDQRGDALMYNGSAWGRIPIDTSTPSTAAALNSVSCPTTSFCVAVDHSGHAFIYNGAWGAATLIDATLPPGSPSLASVSCASTTLCVAVDNTGNWLRYNGSTWTAPVSINGTTALTSVSCPSTSFCAAVDGRGHALTYNGASWSAPAPVDGSSTVLSALSCQSSTFCVAVDGVGKALTYNGIGWSTPNPIDAPTPLTGVSCPTPTYCVAVDQQGYAITGS